MADAYVSTLRFVASYCGAPDPEPSTSGPKQVVCKGGIKGLAAGARHLAEQSPSAQQLLGATPELQAQVDEWLSWASTELSPLTDDKLLKVNSFLSSRTYLVGGSLTVADLVIFGVVGPAVVSFPAAQTLHFANLLRWYDLLQSTVPAASALPRLALSKPRFQPPVAAAPAVSSSSSGATSSAASASTAAAGGAAAAKAPPAKGAAPAAAAAAAPAAAAPAAAAPAKGKAAKAAAAAAVESKPAAVDQAPAATAAAAAPAAPAAGDGKGKNKGGGGGGKAAAAVADEEARIDMLDLRVGKIVKVGKHPNADALYLEEIDVGEEKPRQVISGLVNFVPLERMQDRRVVVVCNLKPAKMRDVMSYGMVLCASNETHDKVEPVDIPEDVPVGERIKVAGYDNAPVEEVNPKKKILEQLFPDMRTDAAGVPVYKGAQFLTSKGPLTSAIPSGWVK